MPSTEPAAAAPRDALVPEDRLVLLLARGELSAEIQAEARALLETLLSWDLILARAEEQVVYPLLHHHLAALGFQGVPPDARHRLESLQRVNALRVTLLAEELTRVLHTLAREAIPAIPFKGPALAQSLYGDPTLRASNDLDLLVPHELGSRAIQTLTSMGYRPEIIAPFLQPLTLRARFEYALVRSGPPLDFHLSLHWGVLLPPRFEREAMRDLWAQAKPATCLRGAPCHAPSPEWELLSLCAHAARHRWHGLKWLADIHDVCATRRIDWDCIETTARKVGWQDVVGISLRLCRRLFDTPLPTGLAAGELPSWLDGTPWTATNPARDIRHEIIGSWLDRVWLLAALALLPTEGEAWLIRLPGPLRILYYPLRPLRLAWRWGKWVTRRAAARVSGRG